MMRVWTFNAGRPRDRRSFRRWFPVWVGLTRFTRSRRITGVYVRVLSKAAVLEWRPPR